MDYAYADPLLFLLLPLILVTYISNFYFTFISMDKVDVDIKVEDVGHVDSVDDSITRPYA
jgi:hypothetical protein